MYIVRWQCTILFTLHKQQQLEQLSNGVVRRNVCGRFAGHASDAHVCAMQQQQLDNGHVAKPCGAVQRCLAIGQRLVDIDVRKAIQQRFGDVRAVHYCYPQWRYAVVVRDVRVDSVAC